MKIPLFTFLFCWTSLTLSAQIAKAKKSLFFETDKYELTSLHQQELDSLLASVPPHDTNRQVEIKRIIIAANADSDADSLYNIQLSGKRAASIQNWFLSKSLAESLVQVSFFGEDNPLLPNISEENKEKNRRVDVEIIFLRKEKKLPPAVVSSPVEEEEKPEKAPKAQPKSCNSDTTIVLPQGTRLVLNICDYHLIKNALQVREFVTPEAMRASGMTTMTARGGGLVSNGMWCFDFGEIGKLRKPITVRVPVDPCFERMRPSLFVLANDGRWGSENRKAIKVVTLGKQKFFEFRVNGSICLNCDKKVKTKKWKFKSRDSLRLLSVKVAFDCPPGIFVENDKTRQGKKRLNLPCLCNSEGALVSIVAKNEKGEILTMDYQPLENLPEFKMTKGCPERKILGLIPIKRSKIRKVNFVRLADFQER